MTEINPLHAARLASLNAHSRWIISQFLSDLFRSEATAPPPSGTTDWQHPTPTLWVRWYHHSLCIVQKRGRRQYEARVNGEHANEQIELGRAQGSCELTARSLHMDMERQNAVT
jgi:hypothetical protein